jgi:hypothetical protein
VALGLPAVEAAMRSRAERPGVGEQALGEAQGHGGVVGPAPGLEAEGAAPDHVGDGGEAAPGHELDRGAHGVADRQPEQGAAGAVERVGVDGRRFRRRVRGTSGRCSPPTSPSGGPSIASSSAPHGSTSTSRRSRPDAPGVAAAPPFPPRAPCPPAPRRPGFPAPAPTQLSLPTNARSTPPRTLARGRAPGGSTRAGPAVPGGAARRIGGPWTLAGARSSDRGFAVSGKGTLFTGCAPSLNARSSLNGDRQRELAAEDPRLRGRPASLGRPRRPHLLSVSPAKGFEPQRQPLAQSQAAWSRWSARSFPVPGRRAHRAGRG